MADEASVGTTSIPTPKSGRQTGLTVPELFARDGEAAFREPRHVLAAACAEARASVVSVAGGAVLRPKPAPPACQRHRGLAPGPARDADAPVGRGRAAPFSTTTLPRPSAGSSGAPPVTPRWPTVDRRGRLAAGAMVAAPIVAAAAARPDPGRGDAVHALSVDLAERSYPVLVGPGARHELARSCRRRPSRP